LNGSAATVAPASAARAAVSSVEPSSTTSTSASGSRSRTSAITAATDSPSFQAGMKTKVLIRRFSHAQQAPLC